jgi:hypothetical protein
MQNWIEGFNSARPVRMLMLTWITLKCVPDEFVGVAKKITRRLGKVVGVHKKNAYSKDQQFCIALTSCNAYETLVTVVNLISCTTHVILVNYNNLLIKCRFCTDGYGHGIMSHYDQAVSVFF